MSQDHDSPRSPAENLRTALVDFLASEVSARHDDEGDDMTRERYDHSQCEHPKTKAGRAACRKALRAAAEPATAESAAKPATPKAGVAQAKPAAKKATTPRKTPTKTPATKAAPKSPVKKATETQPTDTK